MSSRDAITTLVHTYAERLDEGDLDGVARLFSRATYRAEGGGVFRGEEAVLDVLRRLVVLYEGVPRTKHVVSNLTITVDEEHGTAGARSYYTVLQGTGALPLQPILAGRYHDQFACTDGQWHFTDRFIFLDLMGDLSQHLRG